MHRDLLIFLMVFAATLSPHQLIASDTVGFRTDTVQSSQRAAPLDVAIWYPARPGGEPKIIGGSMFFEGVSVLLNAPSKSGKFPLVLMSHGAGLGGNSDALAWLAKDLAAEGFVVAAPTHPYNSGPERSARETMKLWARPIDISDVLTAIGRNDDVKDQIDWPSVGVVGVSMGGSTALLLTGMRLDGKRLAGYCDDIASNPSLCGWLRASEVDLHSLDLSKAELDYSDVRLKFALALDPVPVDILDVRSVAAVNIPVEIINLGREGEIVRTADAASLAKRSQQINYSRIEDGSHFSLFGLCQEGGSEKAIAMEIEEPICDDGGVRSRAELHADIIKRVVTSLKRELVKTQP